LNSSVLSNGDLIISQQILWALALQFIWFFSTGHSYYYCNRHVIRFAEVALGIDEAIPQALITNELFSNSINYAFSDKKIGSAQFDLRFDDDGRYF